MTTPRVQFPSLNEQDVERALEAMRLGRDLREHPLFLFLGVQLRLAQPHLFSNPVMSQVILFEYLTAVIVDRYAYLRKVANLSPPTSECLQEALVDDFSLANTELEAWSLLYHRYVCVERNLNMQEIAEGVRQDVRTLRRRHRLGIYRLTRWLIAQERDARRKHLQQRLRLALPALPLLTLLGVESILGMAEHVLNEADPPHHLVLHGPVGIGKTSIALTLAHRAVDAEVLDEILWLNVAEMPVTLSSLAYESASRLGLFLIDQTPPERILRAYLISHRVMVVLDQAESIFTSPALTERVLTLFDAARLVITSRVRAPTAVWAYELAVPELNYAMALTLAEKVMQREDVSASQGWLTRFEALWSVVRGNPLAIQLGLKLGQQIPIRSALLQTEIAQLYRTMWDDLSSDERRILVFTLFYSSQGAPIPYAIVYTLAGLPQEAIDSSLRHLIDIFWVEANTGTDGLRYSVCSLARVFLLESNLADFAVSPNEPTSVILDRQLEQLVSWLLEKPEPVAALSALHLALKLRIGNETLWSYVFALASQITEQGLWAQWSSYLSLLLDADCSESCRAWLHLSQGSALRWLGQLDQAAMHLECAVAFYSEEENRDKDQAVSLIELAVVRRYQARWDEAHDLATSAFTINLRLESDSGIERCIHELGQIALDSRAPDQAMTWLSRLGVWTARSWGIAAQTYLLQERFEDALEAADRALILLPVDQPNRGRALSTLGQVHEALGQPESAVRYLLFAVDLLDRAKDMIGYARACNNLAVAYMKLPAAVGTTTPQQIRRLLTQALRIQEHIGDDLGVAVTRSNLDWFLSLDQR